MNLKLMVLRVLAGLPERLLPASLKAWMDRESEKILADMKMDVQ